MAAAEHSAWRVVVGDGVQIAVADNEMFEYVVDPQLQSVPFTPIYCSNVMLWREQIVPVMDLSLLVSKPPSVKMPVTVAIVAYQTKPREPLEYLGLLTREPPVRVTVVDDQACDLPASDTDFWESKELALACFNCDGQPTPVVNIAHLCSERFRKSIEQSVASIASLACWVNQE